MKPRCDLGWGREKAPPFRPEGGAEPYLSYSGLLAEGSPVPSAPKTTRGAGIGSRKKGPAEAGPSVRVISLRKEGSLGLPQLDNSAIRSAGTRFLRQRAVAARVLPWSNRYPFPMAIHRRTLALANAGHDTRALQAWLGHKNIQHTVRYTELAPDRFKNFWRGAAEN